jgi:hypothetical protein
MPGYRIDPMVIGKATRCRRGNVDVEPLGLEPCEPGDGCLELLPGVVEIVQALVETEVVEIVGADFVAQERREVLILPEDRVFKLKLVAEHVMAVLDLVDDGGELTSVVGAKACAEDLGNCGRSAAIDRVRSFARTACGWGSLRLKIKLNNILFD